MSTGALHPEQTYARYSPLDDETLVRTINIGPSSASDLRYWLCVLGSRIQESPATLRATLSTLRASAYAEGPRRQQIRAIDPTPAILRRWQ